MNVLQATTRASGCGDAAARRLAKQMGADTVFSANDASTAMLELARGGMSAATIQGGALQGTMTLAAAGELDMAEAANTAVKAMGQFNLKGRDMDGVAAAIAGGANASSASVSDMAQALAQGGLAANSVGFSIQETTGILAAFSNKGLEGSDAGTSLKTALDRLQPTTEKATTAMQRLGIITADGRNKFIDANGEFKSAAAIAETLRQGTEKLDAAERKRLITQAFGSDAQRAATILAEEGAAGLQKMIRATSDQNAAQRMAKANMKGTAGAIEQLKGSAETAMLTLGQGLAPTVRDLANWLSEEGVPKLAAVRRLDQGRGRGEDAGVRQRRRRRRRQRRGHGEVACRPSRPREDRCPCRRGRRCRGDEAAQRVRPHRCRRVRPLPRPPRPRVRHERRSDGPARWEGVAAPCGWSANSSSPPPPWPSRLKGTHETASTSTPVNPDSGRKVTGGAEDYGYMSQLSNLPKVTSDFGGMVKGPWMRPPRSPPLSPSSPTSCARR